MVIKELETELLQMTVERSEQNMSYAGPERKEPDMVADKPQDMTRGELTRRESLLQELRDKRTMVNKEFGIGKGGKFLDAKKEEQTI